MSDSIALPNNYYLFGVHFKGEMGVDGDEKVFPQWHTFEQLDSVNSLRNKFRPLAKIPLLNVTDSENPQLWATSANYKICKLANGSTDSEQGLEVLKPESAIHLLGRDHPIKVDDHYKFRFPPLPLVASLAELDPKGLYEKLQELASELDGIERETQLTLTQISVDQLAPKYKNLADGSLTAEQKAYNDWVDEVTTTEQTLKGFVIPVVSSCAVVFSDKGYRDAKVRLLKFDTSKSDNGDSGNYKKIGEAKVTLPDTAESVSEQQYPCALFHLDPVEFEEGLYSIQVELHSGDMDIIPDFIKSANIDSESDGLDTIYKYELREHITFSSHTPLGKFAIVSGDMISLEESLMYQYPQYFGNMKHYLHGTAQGKAASTPASRSLTLLKNIRDVSAQLGAGLMSGSLQETLDSDGRQAVFNNVSKLYWDAVKSDMPEAMHAAGELYYGIYSTKDALAAVKNLQNPQLANVGWRHLFRAKIFDSSKAAGSALATVMDAHMGNRRVVAGRVADAWFSKGASAGLNVFGTATTGIDLYKKAKAHSKSKENTEQREKNTHEVAEDYLEQVPVWKTNAEYQPDMLDKALQKAREKSGGEISANFVNDARGGGIRIVYDFNSTEIESTTNQPVLEELTVALDELLKDESNLIVEIEGHACQVDTEENNMKVAAERAEKAKAMLLSKSTIFKDRIKLSVFGETKPLYIPKDGEKVDRHNKNLRQNRRVEIRIYMQSLSVIFNASRYGSKAMERSRLALETAMKNEDNLEAELRMAVFDSAVDIASYIPLFAPYARGYLLAKESKKSLVSAVKLIDHALLDSYLDDLDKMHDVKRELERLSNIHIELLNKLRKTNIALETEVGTYQELITHLESEEARQELLKRYQLRALAMNGLILLLAELGIMARASSSPLSYFVERYKVKQYIETYVLRDDWSVRTIKGNTLAANWKHRCTQDYYAQQVKVIPERARYWPMPSNHRLSQDYYSKLRLENAKASGAFNRVFPVQTMLFDHPDESMFENFTQYFNPQSRELDEEAIGFCRILIQSARYDATDNPPWQTYQEWVSSSESGRIGPFDKVKIQLILHKAHQYAQMVTIGYDRVDGSNIQGPAFTDWMLPMKAGDFEADPHGDIAAFYATQGAETLIAIEHTPSYRFGDVMIDGLKPLTSNARLMYHTAITTLAKANSAIASSTDAYFTETDAFQRYVLGGGFSNMAYCLAVRKRDGKHSYHLPLHFKFGEDFSDAKDELSVGGLHTETKSVLLDTYMGEQQLLLREKDLLVESFTLMTDKANQNSIPLLHGIKEQVFAIETESTGIHFFEEDGWRSTPPVLWREGFSWGNKGKQDPASIYMMLLGENHERALYESLAMRWDGVSMAMQLKLDGNDGDPVKGPMYYSSMYHVGEFVYRNGIWQLAYSQSNRYQSEINDMSCFLEQVVQRLENDKGLDENKSYTMYCMKFDLEYISPTGVRVEGLRPFGRVIGGKADLKLSVANLKQVGLQGGEEYESRLKGAVYLPSLYDDKALAGNYFSNAPWLVEKESIDPMVDKSTAETWKQYDEAKRKKWLKDWIEKQPTVALPPKPLEHSLGDPD